MFFTDLAHALMRRWYMVVMGLLLATAAGLGTYLTVPPVYSATAAVLLLPPGPTVPDGGNPYLSLSGLTPAGDVLARALTDPKAATDVATAGGKGAYDVHLDSDSPAPLVVVVVEADTSQDTMTTLDLVLERLPRTLRDVQAAASVPSNAYITPSLVTRTDEPTKSVKSQIRALVVAVGGVLMLALLATAAVDALLRRPQRRQRRRSAAGVAGGASTVDNGRSKADTAVGEQSSASAKHISTASARK